MIANQQTVRTAMRIRRRIVMATPGMKTGATIARRRPARSRAVLILLSERDDAL